MDHGTWRYSQTKSCCGVGVVTLGSSVWLLSAWCMDPIGRERSLLWKQLGVALAFGRTPSELLTSSWRLLQEAIPESLWARSCYFKAPIAEQASVRFLPMLCFRALSQLFNDKCCHGALIGFLHFRSSGALREWIFTLHNLFQLWSVMRPCPYDWECPFAQPSGLLGCLPPHKPLKEQRRWSERAQRDGRTHSG